LRGLSDRTASVSNGSDCEDRQLQPVSFLLCETRLEGGIGIRLTPYVLPHTNDKPAEVTIRKLSSPDSLCQSDDNGSAIHGCSKSSFHHRDPGADLVSPPVGVLELGRYRTQGKNRRPALGSSVPSRGGTARNNSGAP
jgi:hypothetical protein